MNKHVESKSLWYVVISEPMAEIKATIEMKLGGYDVYCPTWRKEIKHHRTKKWTMREFVLMQRYFFVRLASPDLGGFVASFDGVRGLLRVQGFAVPVDDSVIERIRRAVDSGAFDEMRDHGLRLKVGDTVRVDEGKWQGMEGLVGAVKDQRKAKILLSLFQRTVPTEIELENLTKVVGSVSG